MAVYPNYAAIVFRKKRKISAQTVGHWPVRLEGPTSAVTLLGSANEGHSAQQLVFRRVDRRTPTFYG